MIGKEDIDKLNDLALRAMMRLLAYQKGARGAQEKGGDAQIRGHLTNWAELNASQIVAEAFPELVNPKPSGGVPLADLAAGKPIAEQSTTSLVPTDDPSTWTHRDEGGKKRK